MSFLSQSATRGGSGLLLLNDPALRRRMGQAARASLDGQFTRVPNPVGIAAIGVVLIASARWGGFVLPRFLFKKHALRLRAPGEIPPRADGEVGSSRVGQGPAWRWGPQQAVG